MTSKRKIFKKMLWLLSIVLVGGLFISAYSTTLSGYYQQLNKAAANSDVTLALHSDSIAYMH
ncbi:hypothetical protein OAO18_07470 [Francisellaceae bacterium]|nr:hypothetical protein [Francisellaceae bacterium]